MSDIVNLNRFRKKKARADKDAQATENRAKFGRTKAEKARDIADGAGHEKQLDDHQIDRDDQ